LFDLPGATPKRSRLNLGDSHSNQISGSRGGGISASMDSSTSTDQERASSSTGQETDACHSSDDHETGSSTSEGTIVAYDVANTRDCEPVCPVLKSFPKRMISGKLQGFSSQWYAPYPFVEYSVQVDAVFCFACRLFPPPLVHTEEVFIKTGFRNWKKIGEKLQKHAQSEFHKHSIAMWGAYKQVKSHGSITEQLDSQHSAAIRSNRKFLKTIAQVAILCARQNKALRGHDEHDTSLNKGNFLESLDLLADSLICMILVLVP
jgi:hypothetical protein